VSARRAAAALLTAAIVATASGAGAPPTAKAQPAAKASPSPPGSTTSSARDEGASLVGTTPPEWQVERWLNSPPLTLASLRGQVLLVRWWTAGCPYCSTSAPALRALQRDFGPKGLVVVGMYHHKEDGPYDPNVTVKTAKAYGFTFPIAFDPEWRTFHSWMRDVDTGWTSVTFLLDRKGVVRWFHPGGSYEPGDAAYAELRKTVTTLLSER